MTYKFCTCCEIHQENISEIKNELNAVKIALSGYEQGVKNVYDVFKKLTDENFITGFNYKLNEFKYEFKRMRKEIYDNELFVKKGLKAIGSVNDLYRLSKYNPDLIKKLAKIVNMLNIEDNE